MSEKEESGLTSENLEQAMQNAWNDFCQDTGSIPDCFKIHGPGTTRVTADFSVGNFSLMVKNELEAITPSTKGACSETDRIEIIIAEISDILSSSVFELKRCKLPEWRYQLQVAVFQISEQAAARLNSQARSNVSECFKCGRTENERRFAPGTQLCVKCNDLVDASKRRRARENKS